MIVGEVNSQQEARVPITIVAPDGTKHGIDVLVDTGFNGALTLPPSLAESLDLDYGGQGMVALADGSVRRLDIYLADVMWGRQVRRVYADAAETEAMIGMNMLAGHHLQIRVTEDGEVTIEPLDEAR